MKKREITQALTRAAALTIGSAGSRLAADNLPFENTHLKRGGLTLSGIVLAAMVGRSSNSKAFVQDAALGMAATQLSGWIKDALSDKAKENTVVATALGSPQLGEWENPIHVDFTTDTIETEYQEVESDVQFSV